MSSFHSDDFDSNWNDTSSSFQDQLLKNVDQIESNVHTSVKYYSILYTKSFFYQLYI